MKLQADIGFWKAINYIFIPLIVTGTVEKGSTKSKKALQSFRLKGSAERNNIHLEPFDDGSYQSEHLQLSHFSPNAHPDVDYIHSKTFPQSSHTEKMK